MTPGLGNSLVIIHIYKGAEGWLIGERISVSEMQFEFMLSL